MIGQLPNPSDVTLANIHEKAAEMIAIINAELKSRTAIGIPKAFKLSAQAEKEILARYTECGLTVKIVDEGLWGKYFLFG